MDRVPSDILPYQTFHRKTQMLQRQPEDEKSREKCVLYQIELKWFSVASIIIFSIPG